MTGVCVLCSAPTLHSYSASEGGVTVVAGYCDAARCFRAVVLAAERWLALGRSLQGLFHRSPFKEPPRGIHRTGVPRRSPIVRERSKPGHAGSHARFGLRPSKRAGVSTALFRGLRS